MILQALKAYYDRKAADPESGIAPEGFEKKELQFLINITAKGEFLSLEDMREQKGKKLAGKLFLLPRSKQRSGGRSYETTFLLWDHIGYVLGLPSDDEKSAKQHQTWLNSLKALPQELTDDIGVKAVLRFYENNEIAKAIEDPGIAECLKLTQCNMTFRLPPDVPVPCCEKVREFVVKTLNLGDMKDKEQQAEKFGTCLVTGEYGIIARTHGRTPINKDTKSFVNFQKNSGYDSYGKEQGYNAPIIKSTEFAYVTALNTLLASQQRILVGDASAVFWSKNKTQFEEAFAQFFAEPSKDDPGAGTLRIKKLFESPNSGGYVEDSGDEQFYVLGLSPNAARISVRFWRQGTVGEFAKKIRRHFEDLEIVKPKGEPEYYSLWRLLVNTAVQDKSENIPPNIAGDFMRSILDGVPYPMTLLQAVLRRIKSDTKNRVKPVRAALIKAHLNRHLFFCKEYDKREVLNVALDTEQPSIGYQLGRLFAVLEKIQEEAKPGINATIRERYYGAACGSPVTVFPTLMRLKNHHLAKIDNRGRVINRERLIGEITGHFDEFPVHLDLFQQGKFAIGYYHQRQDLFTSKKEDAGTAQTK
jgi:CRISPR-associated protein Csd1